MADHPFGIVFLFVFCDELLSTRKCELSDIRFDFFGSHAEAGVGESEGLRFFVDGNIDAELFIFEIGFTLVSQNFELAHRIAGVGDKLADENIFVGVEPLFDDG